MLKKKKTKKKKSLALLPHSHPIPLLLYSLFSLHIILSFCTYCILLCGLIGRIWPAAMWWDVKIIIYLSIYGLKPNSNYTYFVIASLVYDGFLYPHHYCHFLHSYSERLGGSRSGLLTAGPPLYGAETTADHQKNSIRINTHAIQFYSIEPVLQAEFSWWALESGYREISKMTMTYSSLYMQKVAKAI